MCDVVGLLRSAGEVLSLVYVPRPLPPFFRRETHFYRVEVRVHCHGSPHLFGPEYCEQRIWIVGINCRWKVQKSEDASKEWVVKGQRRAAQSSAGQCRVMQISQDLSFMVFILDLVSCDCGFGEL